MNYEKTLLEAAKRLDRTAGNISAMRVRARSLDMDHRKLQLELNEASWHARAVAGKIASGDLVDRGTLARAGVQIAILEASTRESWSLFERELQADTELLDLFRELWVPYEVPKDA